MNYCNRKTYSERSTVNYSTVYVIVLAVFYFLVAKVTLTKIKPIYISDIFVRFYIFFFLTTYHPDE